jgi:hypothetical protein
MMLRMPFRFSVKEHMELELVPETRSEYLFGTSEVLAHDRIYQRVSNLISDIHKRSEPDAGPLCRHLVLSASGYDRKLMAASS